MADEGQPEVVERVLAAFRTRYAERSPFRQDRELADELALEATPAVEALLVATEGDGDEAARASALDHQEGLAMVTLLGRRAGNLGATPTAVLGMAEALWDALEDVGRGLSAELRSHLTAMCTEGYVAGREERLVDDAADRSASSQPTVRIAPRVLGLLLCGAHEPERIGEVVERFGREMLDADARAALVDVTGLEEPTTERAAEVFAAHATARMLGVACVFSGVTDPWLESAARARIDTDILVFEPSFEEGLHRVLRIAGYQIRRVSWIPGPLRALLRR